MTYDIQIAASLPLPAGYSYGAHVSGAGWSGYYVIRDRDARVCVAAERPDYDEQVSADEIDEAIRAKAECARAIADAAAMAD